MVSPNKYPLLLCPLTGAPLNHIEFPNIQFLHPSPWSMLDGSNGVQLLSDVLRVQCPALHVYLFTVRIRASAVARLSGVSGSWGVNIQLQAHSFRQ